MLKLENEKDHFLVWHMFFLIKAIALKGELFRIVWALAHLYNCHLFYCNNTYNTFLTVNSIRCLVIISVIFSRCLLVKGQHLHVPPTLHMALGATLE